MKELLKAYRDSRSVYGSDLPDLSNFIANGPENSIGKLLQFSGIPFVK